MLSESYSESDPRQTTQLFSRDPPLYIVAGCDLKPNDVDVTAQVDAHLKGLSAQTEKPKRPMR